MVRNVNKGPSIIKSHKVITASEIPKRMRPDSHKKIQKQVTKKITVHKPQFSRVGNTLIRQFQSTLDQSERFVHSNRLTRQMAKKISTSNDVENSKILKLAHISERTKDVNINNRLSSKYSGVDKNVINIATIEKSFNQTNK